MAPPLMEWMAPASGMAMCHVGCCEHGQQGERNKVENFFERMMRFRRIALGCGKTVSGFMGLVFLVSALDWLR